MDELGWINERCLRVTEMEFYHTECGGVESEAEHVLEVEDVMINCRALLHHQLDQLVSPVPGQVIIIREISTHHLTRTGRPC